MIQFIRENKPSLIAVIATLLTSILVVPAANMILGPLYAPELPVNLGIYLIWIGTAVVIGSAVLGLALPLRDFTPGKLIGMFILFLSLILILVVMFISGGWFHKAIAVILTAFLGYTWYLSYFAETRSMIKETIIFVQAMRANRS